ncbi:MAG: glutathione reductase [Eubacteriales bacterium]|nr:glutathione reductase [Eubacteriales bacterium]MDY3332876.1 glutathione reductase [Gallibacter sp.]
MLYLYNSVKIFLENPGNLDYFIESDVMVWIDWREYDEDVVAYFNEKLDDKIEVQLIDNGKPYGDDILLKKDKIELEILYEEEMDRDTTIKYLNDFIKPKYEIRWCLETLGNDTLGFVVLESNEWDELEQEFGKSKLNYYFSQIGIAQYEFAWVYITIGSTVLITIILKIIKKLFSNDKSVK